MQKWLETKTGEKGNARLVEALLVRALEHSDLKAGLLLDGEREAAVREAVKFVDVAHVVGRGLWDVVLWLDKTDSLVAVEFGHTHTPPLVWSGLLPRGRQMPLRVRSWHCASTTSPHGPDIRSRVGL